MLLASYIQQYFKYFHHNSVKSGLKAIDCFIQSAEYWCCNGSRSHLQISSNIIKLCKDENILLWWSRCISWNLIIVGCKIFKLEFIMFTSPIYNFCMAHTLIQIQSYLFIISQPRVSFHFLSFKESSYIVVFTSTYHYIHPLSHFETANGIHHL